MKKESNHNFNITFLTSSLNYPFYRKRMIAIYNHGVKIKVMGFEMELNYLPPKLPVQYESLGFIQSGHYLKRLMRILFAVRKVRRKCCNNDVFYVFGFDMALLFILSTIFYRKKPKLIYEVQDIREILTERSIVGFLMRNIEKLIVKKSNLLVVTTYSYIENYYMGVLNLRDFKYFILENKLQYTEVPKTIPISNIEIPPLRIGYFGVLRCPIAWKALKHLALSSAGNIEVYVRGVPKNIESFQEDIRDIPNIIYGGSYRDPEDLHEVYTKVDIVWIAGFHGKSSYKWARHCRFYNSCCFKKPMISQDGMDESNVVKKLNIGISIDIRDMSSVEKILHISSHDLATWQKNLIGLPKDVYIYTDDHLRLLEVCKKLIND